MAIIEIIKEILGDQLQIQGRVHSFERDTPLLGALAEFDSMAVVNIVVALEQEFGFSVDDDELSAEVFETLGSLVDFVEAKV